jgi:hypothetical protein
VPTASAACMPLYNSPSLDSTVVLFYSLTPPQILSNS